MKEFMQKAISLARQVKNDIPVGAVIVKDNQIISSGFNTRRIDNFITSHAEIIALQKASQLLNDWRLTDCDLYVTLEPCPMCGWAILQSRIRNLYFGAYDTKYGAFTVANLDKMSDTKPNIYGGICEDECEEMLKNFFKNLRK